mgnify:CR=1 FL=1
MIWTLLKKNELLEAWLNQETLLRKQILVLGSKKCFKNVFASRTQVLRPKHLFHRLATMKTKWTNEEKPFLWDLAFSHRRSKKILFASR